MLKNVYNPPVVFACELYINREYYISMLTILCKRHKKTTV